MPTSCRRAARAIFGTIRSTVKAFPIAIRGRRRNSIARAPTMRSNHGSSFVDEPNKGDRISLREVPAIEEDWAGKEGWAIEVEPAKSVADLAQRRRTAVAPAGVVIVAVQANSAAVAVAAVPSMESAVAAVLPEALASAAALAGAASAAVELPEVAAVAAAVVVAEAAGDAAGNLVSGVRFRLNQDLEEWNVRKMGAHSTIPNRDSVSSLDGRRK